MTGQDAPIAAIVPRGAGHQFVLYGDACSGVPAAPHEATFARTNAAVARLEPAPEFVIFAGDEIAGLTGDEMQLRDQWRHWLDVEMSWLDRAATPLYNTTSNHTTYDVMSEGVFADVLATYRATEHRGRTGCRITYDGATCFSCSCTPAGPVSAARAMLRPIG